MIHETDIFKIGKFIKPHGLKGEVATVFDTDVLFCSDTEYIICNIDGIFVPFFIENVRSKNNLNAIISLKDIDSEEKAQRFSGLEIFIPYHFVEEAEKEGQYGWNFFIGFEVFDKNHGRLGIVEAVDDSTINTLFIVCDEAEEYLIPAVEEFIVKIDTDQKIVELEIPEGLIE